MKRLALFAMLIAAPAAAQTVVDGSDKRLPPNMAKIVHEGLPEGFYDPESLKIKGLRASASADGTPAICGMWNAKNRYGGYIGYEPFVLYKTGTHSGTWASYQTTGKLALWAAQSQYNCP